MVDAATQRVQQLFVRHQPAIRVFALGLTGDFASAEDVVQETFLTVTAKAGEFRPDTNFVAWACAIARFKVLELNRSRRRFSSDFIEVLGAAAPTESFGQERLERLLECLDKLPEKAREVVRLRYFGEHGLSEIAAILGRTVAGVNSTLVKARESLRQCVEGRGVQLGSGGQG